MMAVRRGGQEEFSYQIPENGRGSRGFFFGRFFGQLSFGECGPSDVPLFGGGLLLLDDQVLLKLGLAPFPGHAGKASEKGQQDQSDKARHYRIAATPPPYALRSSNSARANRFAGQESVEVVGQVCGAGIALA